MSTAMDFYLSTDSISLQEMLDIDIKSEIDTLVGGHNDLTGFNFSDLPPLELDESPSDFNRWFSSNSNHSNSSFNGDFLGTDGGATLVNPNTVMPRDSSTNLAQSIRSPSPTLKQSHLTFSPSIIKLEKAIKSDPVDNVKKDLMICLDDNKKITTIIKQEAKLSSPHSATSTFINGTTTTTTVKFTPILTKPTIKTIPKSSPTLLTFKSALPRNMSSPITVTHVDGRTMTVTTTNTARTVNHGRKQQFNNNRIFDEDEKSFPKPAYSYSCLIAMALKNSRTGSLPVSEIYNFMCRHFPYFKTAPNGWKNSVRHNLSLNKCFEKIEKPALSGAQRKGCLWAMNPDKISKMDEEVQKWSRKDPNAIRKAMVNPDDLESLERGELKFTCNSDGDGEGEIDNFGDSCGSAEEGSEEGSDTDVEPDTTINVDNDEQEYIHVSDLTADDGADFDIEVADTMYDDLSDDQELLRMEMALAQRELMEYERSVNNKRKKIAYVIHD